MSVRFLGAVAIVAVAGGFALIVCTALFAFFALRRRQEVARGFDVLPQVPAKEQRR